MCSEFYVDGELCSNVRELRAVLGDKFVCLGGEPLSENQCLCSLDAEATAQMNDMQVRPGKNEWAGTTILYRKGRQRIGRE